MSNPIPSRITLDKTIPRATRLLNALAQRPDIYKYLALKGSYSPQHHRRGLDLLMRAMGTTPALLTSGREEGSGHGDDVARCAEADDIVLAQLDAALRFDHAAVYAILAEGLQPDEGVKAVTNLRLLTSRVSELKADPGAVEGGAGAVQAALEAMASFGLTQARLDELEALATRAGELPEVEVGALPTLSAAEVDAARVALYQWHRGWARIARSVVTRRDWLIRLGLARRRVTPQGEVIELVEEDDAEE
jgi:hypothetical protein